MMITLNTSIYYDNYEDVCWEINCNHVLLQVSKPLTKQVSIPKSRLGQEINIAKKLIYNNNVGIENKRVPLLAFKSRISNNMTNAIPAKENSI